MILVVVPPSNTSSLAVYCIRPLGLGPYVAEMYQNINGPCTWYVLTCTLFQVRPMDELFCRGSEGGDDEFHRLRQKC